MRMRKTKEYQIECQGCGSLLRVGFDELRFEGVMDQRLQCPACRSAVLVIQGGSIVKELVPMQREKDWKKVDG